MDLQAFSVTGIVEHLFFSFGLLFLLILIARAVVARTDYSSVLILIVFGLAMGIVLTRSGITTPGIPELPLIDLINRSSVIALVVIFFNGGRELRKIFGDVPLPREEILAPSHREVFYGTNSSHLTLLIRSFFLLIGISGISRLLLGMSPDDPLQHYYPLMGYVSLIIALVLIDTKAIVQSRRHYIQRGIIEIFLLLGILIAANSLTLWQGNTIELPEILFIIILSSALGASMYNWQLGATFNALLFGGLPLVLTANFIVGGSLLEDSISKAGEFDTSFIAALLYGFVGQLFWLFGGMSLIIWFGKNRYMRNLISGISGGLSHTGLLAASTAGEFGKMTAVRAAILSIISLFSYLFVTIIARLSMGRPIRIVVLTVLVILLGLAITAWSLKLLRRAENLESEEIRALMLFSFGWQMLALFGGVLIFQTFNIDASYGDTVQSANLSHLGLFAILQEGTTNGISGRLMPFIHAMPLLAYPILFWLFGNTINNQGKISTAAVRVISLLSVAGIAGIAGTAVLLYLC